MIVDSLVKEFKDTALLLRAGGDGRPNSLTPPLSPLATRPVRDMAIQHNKADSLFRQIIGWRKAWCRGKSKIGVLVLAETSGHVLGRFVFRSIQAGSHQIITGRLQGLLERRRLHQLPLMEGMEQRPQGFQQPLAVGDGSRFRQRREELHIPD